MKYVTTLPVVNFNMVMEGNCSLSSGRYQGFHIKNKNRRKVRDFMSRPLTSDDLGEEVGSLNYIEHSPKKFLKTKALQDYSYIPCTGLDSEENIRPSCFVNKCLAKYDVIISKDSNIGEAAILDRDYPNVMLSGAIYRLPVKSYRFYLFAFLKHPLFKEQLDYITPRGSVIRHCKTLFLDCEIPYPNQNSDETIQYIERIVKSIIDKERLIKERHSKIISEIEEELSDNQEANQFFYKPPTYDEVSVFGRLDAKPYSEQCQRILFKIRNYIGGSNTIEGLGFSLSRGQNLQVSNIGESIYSESYHKGFYTLMLPKFLSKYGTCERTIFLGNPRRLKTLQVGDLIFGAEGFEKGRSFIVIEPTEKTITNIHGITIKNKADGKLSDAVFVKCFLDYLRSVGLIDMLAVGGNGGSLAQKYWDVIPFPNFNSGKKEYISKLFHNPNASFDFPSLTHANFDSYNNNFDNVAGVYELDKAVKHLKARLNEAIERIANDECVSLTY